MKAIIGEENPIIGVKYTYKLNGLIETSSLNPNVNYVWFFYRKAKNGNWDSIGIKKFGKEVAYFFTEKSLGKNCMFKVYEITPNMVTGGQNSKLIDEFSFLPRKNSEQKINRVTLFNRGAKDINKASYTDTLIAKAECMGLYGKKIVFHLWEDDAKGNGHNAEVNQNNKNKRSYTAEVDKNGIAEAKIPLTQDESILRNMANQFMMASDKSEGENHEYYVTATYNGNEVVASKVNVDVANPDYKPKRIESKAKPKSDKPREDSAKASTNPNSKKNKSSKDGRIKAVYILNKYGIPISDTSFTNLGEEITVSIDGINILEKKVTLKLWTAEKVCIYNQTFEATSNIYKRKIYLSPELKEVIEKENKNVFSPHQEIFAEVIFIEDKVESNKIKVNYLMTPTFSFDKTKKPAIIGNTKKKEPSSGKCPNCEKDITVAELQQVYTKATTEGLKELVEVFNKYKKFYKLDTCARKAHFFAQSMQEVGDDLESGIRGESFNYYKGNLVPAGLKAFATTEGEKIAENYARKETKGNPVSEANQIVLANYAYGYQYETGKNFKNTGKNDGWNFRGRGLLQITGRSNYEAIQKRIDKFASDANVNIFKKYDSPHKAISIYSGYMSVKEATLTGMADWYKDDMFVQASKTGTQPDDKVVDLIVDIINKHTSSRELRQGHYQKTKVTFLVNSCKNISLKNAEEKTISNNKSEMLSKYLSYNQAIASDTAKNKKLSNIPNKSEIENLKYLGINVYDKIYEKFKGNVKLTSVYRSEEVNKAVKGSKTSQHRFGQALDIKGTNGVTNKQIFKYVKENLDYHQIIWEFGTTSEPSWVHIGYKPKGNEKKNTRALTVNMKTKYITFDLKI